MCQQFSCGRGRILHGIYVVPPVLSMVQVVYTIAYRRTRGLEHAENSIDYSINLNRTNSQHMLHKMVDNVKLTTCITIILYKTQTQT